MVKQPKEKSPRDEETDEIIRTVADRLAAARNKRGLTQREVGELAELTQQRIYELEQGTANVTVRTLVRIARVLDVDLSDLFSGLGLGSDTRFVEAIDRWSKSLEERRAFDRAFEAELVVIIERAKEIAIRRQGSDNRGISKETPPSEPPTPMRKP